MRYFIFLFTITAIAYVSCTDPIGVGADILEADGTIGVNFDDTISIPATMITGDSSVTFRKLDGNNYFASTYMVGVMEDDTFGRSEAISYFSVDLLNVMPDLTSLEVDSVIMSIRLDSLGQYGDENAVHELEVFRMEDNIPADENDDVLYSNQFLEYKTLPVYSGSRKVNHRDSINVRSYTEDSIIQLRPQLRIPLDAQFWKSNSLLLADSTDFRTNMNELIAGYAIKSTPNESSMIGLNLTYDDRSNDFSEVSSIDIYYQPTDSTKSIFSIRLGRLRHSYYAYDFTGSIVEEQMEKDDPDLLFLQSQAGVSLEFDLSAVENFQDKILNYGRLRLFVERESSSLDPIPQLFAFFRNDEEELVTIADLSRDLSDFDGSLSATNIDGLAYDSYTLNLTNQLNAFIDSDITTGTIVIYPNARSQRPQRSIILGPGHPDRPPVLQLILSNP